MATAAAVNGLARTYSTHEPEGWSLAQAADRRGCVRARAIALSGHAAQQLGGEKPDREGAEQRYQRLALDEVAQIFG